MHILELLLLEIFAVMLTKENMYYICILVVYYIVGYLSK